MHGDRADFDARTLGKRRDAYSGAGWRWSGERLRIDRVHRGELAEVHEVDGHGHDIRETEAVGSEHRGEVRKRLARLRLDAARELAGARVRADLTAEVELLTRANRLRVGTDGCGSGG